MADLLRIGTRGSDLALRQTNIVVRALADRCPLVEFEVVVIRTAGDAASIEVPWRADMPGWFTSELQLALEGGRIDLAVHSLKDLPTEVRRGTRIGAVLAREDPSDVLVARHPGRLQDLAPGARIGTSSLRRRAQVLGRRRDLDVVEISGNVPSRLTRVEKGDLDGVILARAGLRRLDYEDRISEVLPADDWLPAPGQGAIAVEIRHADVDTGALVRALDDEATRLATTAERAFMRALRGGCRAPVGALARRLTSGTWALAGTVADSDGRKTLRGLANAGGLRDDADASALGEQLANQLLAAGAGDLLAQARVAVSDV